MIEDGAGEADVSSALYVPSIKAIATGDQVFNGAAMEGKSYPDIMKDFLRGASAG